VWQSKAQHIYNQPGNFGISVYVTDQIGQTYKGGWHTSAAISALSPPPPTAPTPAPPAPLTPGHGSPKTRVALSVHVQRTLVASRNVHITFRAAKLPEGGYYYAVIVLKPYKHHTEKSPPPCSTSSDMQRTDYGFPQPNGVVALALTPAKSATGHWCRGGTYVGGIYAVPHAPPCEGTYPCRSEPYKGPCAGIAPGCVQGVVARPREYTYPDGLPAPLADGTKIVGRFTVEFPSRQTGARRSRKPRALRELRSRAGLTQEQLAERLDAHPTFVGRG
jgi:hypothetical protein